MPSLTTVLLACGLAVAPAVASAGQIDAIENMFGASNVNAITGHGGLTLGVSKDGDVSVLLWPNPSQADQLAYISSNAPDARMRPRFGASEGAGAFVGLLVDLGGGATPVVSWLRDEAWETTQGYGASDGPNVHTVHTRADWGLTVTVVDAVAPDSDVWVRHVTVERDPSSPVAAAWLLTYANLSPVPMNDRIPELPVVDWALDGRNDFAAVWDAGRDAVVHFHPADQRLHDGVAALIVPDPVDWGPVGAALALGTPDPAAVAALAADLDAAYAPGVYLALTTSPPPDQHQIGYDETDLCGDLDGLIDNAVALPETLPSFEIPIDPALLDSVRCTGSSPPHVKQGWLHAAADAWQDLADGELSGSDLAAGEVSSALRTPLAFTGDVAEASVVLAAGSTAAEARSALDAVTDPAGVPALAQQALDAWLAALTLPSNPDPLVVQVARRSVINVRVGTVADNGAIVASITRQPPYGLDWPRDGAFFNVLLDVTGQAELVSRRTELYDQWQRKEPVEPLPLIDQEPPPDPDTGSTATYPAGAWEMNYYADGAPGGIYRFEIDNAGFALWAMVAHAGWLPEGDRVAYLQARWDAIARAADLLERWEDPATGLQAPAQEDDHAEYKATLHGAVTVFAGLDMASRAARELGESEASDRWGARARELRLAIFEHMVDPDSGEFVADPAGTFNPSNRPQGVTAWLAWPTEVLPPDDPRVVAQMVANLDTIEPQVELEAPGGSYFMKTTTSASLVLGGSEAHRARLQQMVSDIARQATAGTHQFGEVMVTVAGEGGEPMADQRVSTPHLWEGTLFFLTVQALDDPVKMRAYLELAPSATGDPPPPPDEPAPDVDATADGPASDAGAEVGGHGGASGDEGCAAGGRPWLPAWLALGLLGLAVRRRKYHIRVSDTAI